MTDTSDDLRGGFYGPGIIDPLDIIAKHEAMNQRLRARIYELEAELALMRGSMAPTPQPDEPATITHDVPPNAPR
jgi:hypothetical protein